MLRSAMTLPQFTLMRQAARALLALDQSPDDDRDDDYRRELDDRFGQPEKHAHREQDDEHDDDAYDDRIHDAFPECQLQYEWMNVCQFGFTSSSSPRR